MQVFGNSNSLPISLVISLSKTLSGLHWDRVPNDNDDEVAARGILYLIIFQQLGQLLRWSWGYRVLLAPREYYLRDEEERVNVKIDHGHETYSDHPHSDDATAVGSSTGHQTPPRLSVDSSDSFLSSAHTAVHHQSPLQQPTNSEDHSPLLALPNQSYGTFMVRRNKTGGLFRFPEIEPRQGPLGPQGLKGWMRTRKECARDCLSRGQKRFSAQMGKAFSFLPRPIQRAARWGGGFSQRFLRSMWEFMNPPLWAMLIAVVVASIPSLQATFFERGTFINNSVTQAIESNAGVAVPLILVVLGANLERSTLPKETFYDHEDPKEEKKLVIASLFARMLVPTLIMGPLLALTAKFVPVSILDDPIFIIVCFLLIGAPSALQLAQICQINNVYMGAMSNLLFQSYVIWWVSLIPCHYWTPLTVPPQDPAFDSRSRRRRPESRRVGDHVNLTYPLFSIYLIFGHFSTFFRAIYYFALGGYFERFERFGLSHLALRLIQQGVSRWFGKWLGSDWTAANREKPRVTIYFLYYI